MLETCCYPCVQVEEPDFGHHDVDELMLASTPQSMSFQHFSDHVFKVKPAYAEATHDASDRRELRSCLALQVIIQAMHLLSKNTKVRGCCCPIAKVVY